jgi:ribosome-binding factor A
MARPNSRTRRQAQPKQYPRMVRVNELIHEILADELELIEDERLELVTVTHVEVDPDLRRAVVDISSLGEAEESALEGLSEHRVRLQSAIGRQARLKRTPELRFQIDAVIDYAARIEQVLADNPLPVRADDIRADDIGG